jgi:glutamate racemase
VPEEVTVISQGNIVAKSLEDYLNRHPEIEQECSRSGNVSFFTTDAVEDFNNKACIFYGKNINATKINL